MYLGLYIEDITCPRVDTNFIFSCSTRYLTSECRENSPNTVRSSYEHFRSFSHNVRRCPKISEDCQRLPNISEQTSKMFRSYRNEFWFIPPLNFVNLIAYTASLLSAHVKISNLSSHGKISCFHSKRNPCNSLKFI